MEEFKRRIRLDLMKPAEVAIYVAMNEVEKLPADIKLTEAVTLLAKAKDLVSDFIDGVGVVQKDQTVSNDNIDKDAFTKEEEALIRRRYPDTPLTKDRKQFFGSTNQGFGYWFVEKKKGKIRYYSHAPSDVDVDTGQVNSYHNFETEYNSVEDYIKGNGVVITDKHER